MEASEVSAVTQSNEAVEISPATPDEAEVSETPAVEEIAEKNEEKEGVEEASKPETEEKQVAETRRHTLALGTKEKNDSEKDEAEERLRRKAAQQEEKLLEKDDTIKYLKELLMVRDKRLDTQKKELEGFRSTPAAHDVHHKQVYSLVEKLQKTEEEVQALMGQLGGLKKEMQSNEEKAVLYDAQAAKMAQKDKKIEQLTHFLKDSRTQMRQQAPQMARLKNQEKALLQQMREMEAKYGQLTAVQVAEVIDRQREFGQENEELKERMVMKDMTINELKLMNNTLETELEKTSVKLTETSGDKEKMEELMRRRLVTSEERNAELEKELADARAQLIDVAAEVTRLQQDKQVLTAQAMAAEKSLVHARELNAVNERETELLVGKIEALEREAVEQDEEEQVIRRKLQATVEQYQAIAKEMAFKDAIIQSLQEKRKQPEEETQPTPAPVRSPGSGRSGQRNQSGRHQRSASRSDELAMAVERLKSQLDDSKEAMMAHQSHSSFLSSEMRRVQREKTMEIEVKNETIHRLRKDLAYTQKLYDDLRVGQMAVSEADAGAYSPPTQRLRSRPRNTSVKTTARMDEVDDLKSQIHILKQQYFRSLALGIKLQLTKFFVAPNINVDELFEAMPADLPVQDWPQYVERSMQKIIDKQQKEGNLVNLRH